MWFPHCFTPTSGKACIHTSYFLPGKDTTRLARTWHIRSNTVLYGKLILTRTNHLRIVQQFQFLIFDLINLISLCLTLWNRNISCSRRESKPIARFYTDSTIPAPTCGSIFSETTYLLPFREILKEMASARDQHLSLEAISSWNIQNRIVGKQMNNVSEWVWYEVIVPQHLARGTEKNHEDLSEENRCPGRDSSWECPKYKSRTLQLHQPVWSKFCTETDQNHTFNYTNGTLYVKRLRTWRTRYNWG